ncbi:hypothetical protein BDQ12DRAFT_189458 [Crucibulum laeve]|uniref:Uncharacterized protein n=1 Tax=Crucibulum laeve TaxID=68775 RepID=A0A5C3ME15_9AGAR|nr:hypothetical protein BDQ12DRAFT_189458 [Crucibulum laeve]
MRVAHCKFHSFASVRRTNMMRGPRLYKYEARRYQVYRVFILETGLCFSAAFDFRTCPIQYFALISLVIYAYLSLYGKQRM